MMVTTGDLLHMLNTMKKNETLTKNQVFEIVKRVQLSDEARNVIYCIIENAEFKYCMIAKQLIEVLNYPRPLVESALNELIQIGLVKQQALLGNQRTYILNPQYFTHSRPPVLNREQLRGMLKLHVSDIK